MGAVSLLAISFNLDFVASLINFGALIAFTFVNLTVIVYFAYRRREINGARQIFTNIVLPLIGMGLTIVLWIYLSAESTRYGITWFIIGIGVLLWITRFFRRPRPSTWARRIPEQRPACFSPRLRHVSGR